MRFRKKNIKNKNIRKLVKITVINGLLLQIILLSGCTNNIVTTMGWAHANVNSIDVIISGKLEIGTTTMAEDLWFDWKEKGSIYNDTISATESGGSTFNAIVVNLNRLKIYEFRACVYYNGKTYKGGWVDCQPGLPKVQAGDIISVDWDQETAIVSGTLKHMGGADTCSIIVKYGIHDSRGYKTRPKTLFKTGYIEFEIDRFPNDALKWGFGWHIIATNDVGEYWSKGPYFYPPE